MKNIFEMGANFGDGWVADNKQKSSKKSSIEFKPPEKHQLHFAKEKRRGKVVTIAKPFHLTKGDLQLLLSTLKKKLGTGGTIKENALEFQGEVAQKLRKELEILHYRFNK